VASLLEVGTGFHPELTGRENIYLNGAILGMTRAEIKRKFDEIVAFAEVEKFLDTPVKRYSSGMYVRLAFAVAAHLEPEILVVDEVLAVGDAEFQKKCLGKMQDVAGQGRTVLFVSHNMSAIEQMCSRCILLRSGAITVDGLPAEVLSQYLTDVKLAVNGGIDLKNHPLRLKCYKSIISEITIKNSRYEPTTRLPTEDNAVFDIVIEPSQQIREPRIAISIEDSYGRRLMTMTSYFSHMPLSRISRKTIIRCESGPLRLAPGKYLLSVSVGTKQDGLLDSIDGATWFEVEWNSGNNNGEVYSPDYGPLLREAVWRSI
jgi:lipopolysaccharide transport system ATP-binding protein